ncbi:MAG TPA: hypothetical protein VEX65_07525 [Flavisolibacter sp.]|nr:hypothetical protein [Flavisolibacter sp.]
MNCRNIAAALAIIVSCTQCNFQKIGRDTTKGISQNTEAIGRNLITGVNSGLGDSAFKANLYQLVDSLTTTAGGGMNRSVQMLVDSLLNDRWIYFTRNLVEEATGQRLRSNVAALSGDLEISVAKLLGPATIERVRLLIATAMNEALSEKLQLTAAGLRESMTGEPLRNNIAALRDSLLNDKTNAAIKAIVDTAMLTIAYRMKNDINPSLQDNLSFIQRNATTLLIVVGIIALVVIIVVWRLKQKYAKMTAVVASQIYSIPDQRAYDELTSRIKEKATIAGVEPSLRKMLDENGMLGKESRESWQTKRAALLQSKN